MIPSSKSDWEKYLERRTNNIGFVSKLGAFRDPTPAEKAAALAIETKAWQESVGQKSWALSEEYSIPYGPGINLKSEENKPRLEMSKDAYIKTKMELVGKYQQLQIDLKVYNMNWFQKIWYQLTSILKRRSKIKAGYSYAEIQEIKNED